MSESYCENCKYWSLKSHQGGYHECLRWVVNHEKRIVPRPKYPDRIIGHGVLTPMAFGCNAFKEKEKGPFFVSRCKDVEDFWKAWFVMADFGRRYSTVIGGAVRKDEAEKTVKLLNEYWLKHEKREGS